MRIVLKRDVPNAGLLAGAKIAEVDVIPEVSLNFVVDAIKNGLATDVMDEPKPKPETKKKAKRHRIGEAKAPCLDGEVG